MRGAGPSARSPAEQQQQQQTSADNEFIAGGAGWGTLGLPIALGRPQRTPARGPLRLVVQRAGLQVSRLPAPLTVHGSVSAKQSLPTRTVTVPSDPSVAPAVKVLALAVTL